MKKVLDRVTLVIIDTRSPGQAQFSLHKSLEQIVPAETLFFTHIDLVVDPRIKLIKIEKLKDQKDYSKFIIKELYKYIKTDFVLVTQWDGYVLNGDSLDDEFYDYDYIGAPWLYVDSRNIGNGGFSLRSKKLHMILGADDIIEPLNPEDDTICRLYRPYLEKNYGIKFAPEELADKFSYELRTPIQKTFGFHGHFHKPFQKTIIIKRTASLGDVIMTEPVLQYFFEKDYRVVLDTLPQFKNLFQQHYFKIHSLEELDNRLLPNCEVYDLDSSYEVNPKQLHLQSYYQACGITDGLLINPRLSLSWTIDERTRIFKKYVIIHTDLRDEPHRNIYGIEFEKVVKRFKKFGYDVIHLGMGNHEPIEGALEMKTPTESLLLWVVAGASMFIGIDSGIAHIASGFNIPSVIFFGSVDPNVIYPDLSNKLVIHNHDKKVCDTPFCWNNAISYNGKECYVDKYDPPCTKFDTHELLEKIANFMKEKQLI